MSGGVAAQQVLLRRGELGVGEFAPLVAIDQVLELCDAVAQIRPDWRRLRDDADVASIFTSGIRLNRKYIQHWANEWDVANRWEAFQKRK